MCHDLMILSVTLLYRSLTQYMTDRPKNFVCALTEVCNHMACTLCASAMNTEL